MSSTKLDYCVIYYDAAANLWRRTLIVGTREECQAKAAEIIIAGRWAYWLRTKDLETAGMPEGPPPNKEPYPTEQDINRHRATVKAWSERA